MMVHMVVHFSTSYQKKWHEIEEVLEAAALQRVLSPRVSTTIIPALPFDKGSKTIFAEF